MAAAVASSTALSYTGGTGSFSKPSGTVNGDWLALLFVSDGASDTGTLDGVDPVSLGWTNVTQQVIGGFDNQQLGCWVKQASGEPASWTVATGSGDASWAMARITGSSGQGATAQYKAGSTGDFGTSVSLVSDGITTTAANSLLVWFGSSDFAGGGTSSATGPTTPGTWSQDNNTTNNTWTNLALASSVQAAIGASGACNGTATVPAGSTGQQSQTLLFEFLAAAAAGTALSESAWHPMEPQTNPLTVSVW